MATLSDLPLEVLTIIFQGLSPSAIISTCLVSKRLYEACLPVLYASFKASSDPKQTWRRFQSFLKMITRDHSLGRHVRSVLINHINGDDIADFRNSVISLLSQASNIQQLAIPGHPKLLRALKRALLSCDLPLQRLRAFQCMNCGPGIWGGPGIWDIIPHFPRLSRLSLRNHSCGWSTLQLEASSLPIEHILLDGCDLGTQAICAMIRSCTRLVSFRYLRPVPRGATSQGQITIHAHDTYKALLLHKGHLEELLVQDDCILPYDEYPKFGSFGDFPALQRLGVECNTLSVQATLPPSLRSVAIRHCTSSKSADALLYLGSHPVLEAIQFDDADAGVATVFQRWQALGRIRKEIKVHLVPAFASYARQRNLPNLVNYPLQWIDLPVLS
jgi:hypothetical protein